MSDDLKVEDGEKEFEDLSKPLLRLGITPLIYDEGVGMGNIKKHQNDVAKMQDRFNQIVIKLNEIHDKKPDLKTIAEWKDRQQALQQVLTILPKKIARIMPSSPQRKKILEQIKAINNNIDLAGYSRKEFAERERLERAANNLEKKIPKVIEMFENKRRAN